MQLQKYLATNGSIDELRDIYGVNTYEHPTLPLIGFKYGIIESKHLQFHPIVRECRGIVLEKDTWEVIAHPFNRFFNLGEDKETESIFNWYQFTCEEKLDGSLIIVYNYKGEWLVNTSGSFGLGVCYNSGMTWTELFWTVSGIDKKELNPAFTYIFELCTKYNKIVRSYEMDIVSLIGVRDNTTDFEIDDLNYIASTIGVFRPLQYKLKSNELLDFLYTKSVEDPTFEGFVVKDEDFNRIKIKTDSYKQLHKLKGNNQFSLENIVPQILNGNTNLLATTFPEWYDELSEVIEAINLLRINIENVMWETENIMDRKEFACHVTQTAYLPALAFMIRDGKATLQDVFKKCEKLIIKYLEKNL